MKLWGIGNEPWGDWQFGHMPIAQYVHKHNGFAKAMRSVVPRSSWLARAERIPALRAKRIPLNIDEWALTGFPPNSYKVAPANAWTLHEMIRHADVIHAAAYTFGTSLLSATRNQAQLNPAGQVFKLYSRHFGKIPVRVIGDRPQPAPKYPIGGEQPKVNAGSDTYPLDVVAAWSEDRKQLTVAVINPTESDERMTLRIEGANVAGGTLRRLAHANLDYVATPGQPSEVKIAEQALRRTPRQIVIPRYSMSLYSLEVTD